MPIPAGRRLWPLAWQLRGRQFHRATSAVWFRHGLHDLPLRHREAGFQDVEFRRHRLLPACLSPTPANASGRKWRSFYIRDLAFAAGSRPVRELKGFQKVLLQPGETRTGHVQPFAERVWLL